MARSSVISFAISIPAVIPPVSVSISIVSTIPTISTILVIPFLPVITIQRVRVCDLDGVVFVDDELLVATIDGWRRRSRARPRTRPRWWCTGSRTTSIAVRGRRGRRRVFSRRGRCRRRFAAAGMVVSAVATAAAFVLLVVMGPWRRRWRSRGRATLLGVTTEGAVAATAARTQWQSYTETRLASGPTAARCVPISMGAFHVTRAEALLAARGVETLLAPGTTTVLAVGTKPILAAGGAEPCVDRWRFVTTAGQATQPFVNGLARVRRGGGRARLALLVASRWWLGGGGELHLRPVNVREDLVQRHVHLVVHRDDFLCPRFRRCLQSFRRRWRCNVRRIDRRDLGTSTR